MSRALFALLCVLQITNNHSAKGPEPRIVNGDPIDAKEYPWMVSLRVRFYLEYDDSYYDHNFCGASLISVDPPIVITAAHCLDDVENGISSEREEYYDDIGWSVEGYYVDINRTYPDTEVEGDEYESLLFDASAVYQHPRWNTSNLLAGFDIALIIFTVNDTINMDIDPLPTIPTQQLSKAEECCAENEEFTVIGYGKNATEGVGTMSLEQSTLEYVDLVSCVELWFTYYETMGIPVNITETVNALEEDPRNDLICLAGDDTDICQGDSGGPSFRMIDDVPEIIGLTSFTWVGCNTPEPSGFTSTAHYVNWVENTISWVVDGISADPTTFPTAEPTSPTTEPTPAPTEINGATCRFIQTALFVSFIFSFIL